MPAPVVKRNNEKNHYVVRMAFGGTKIRCIIPDAELVAVPGAGKEKAALQKARATAKSFYDSIQEK